MTEDEERVEKASLTPSTLASPRFVCPAVVLIAMFASAACIALFASPATSARRAGIVDLSWEDSEDDLGPFAPLAKQIVMVELKEGEDEYGTHELILGHGGVEFGVTSETIKDEAEDLGVSSEELDEEFGKHGVSELGVGTQDQVPKLSANQELKEEMAGTERNPLLNADQLVRLGLNLCP